MVKTAVRKELEDVQNVLDDYEGFGSLTQMAANK